MSKFRLPSSKALAPAEIRFTAGRLSARHHPNVSRLALTRVGTLAYEVGVLHFFLMGAVLPSVPFPTIVADRIRQDESESEET